MAVGTWDAEEGEEIQAPKSHGLASLSAFTMTKLSA